MGRAVAVELGGEVLSGLIGEDLAYGVDEFGGLGAAGGVLSGDEFERVQRLVEFESRVDEPPHPVVEIAGSDVGDVAITGSRIVVVVTSWIVVVVTSWIVVVVISGIVVVLVISMLLSLVA